MCTFVQNFSIIHFLIFSPFKQIRKNMLHVGHFQQVFLETQKHPLRRIGHQISGFEYELRMDCVTSLYKLKAK